MRWLLLKDLQILRRSPLLVGLLVFYPIAIALMIGFALSSPPGKPKVAVVSDVPKGQSQFNLGSEKIDASQYTGALFEAIDPIRVKTRDAALAKVRSGEALAAVIIPPDIVQKIQSELQTGTGQPTVELALNVKDPLEQQFVDSTIKARLSDLQQALSGKIVAVAVQQLQKVLDGGSIDIVGQNVSLLGLRNSRTILQGTRGSLPRGSPLRAPLDQVVQFASLAITGLSFANPVLGTINTPIQVQRTTLSGKTTPADSYAVAIAVVVSLMFVTVLLAAGMLALEREEHAFARLVRGLVSRTALLGEKMVLSAACAAAVTLVMLMGIGAFKSLAWGRFPLWVLALVVGGLAFAALGVAVGSLAREVRAASLLAFLLSLPIAFLALVPPNAVSGGLHTVLSVVSGLFPFKPALQAMGAALNDTQPGILVPLLHLLALTLGFGAIARLALRRF